MIRDTVPFVNSVYEATTHRSYYPPLHDHIDADVCVIGGGIAGCSTALHLAQRNYRVVLLEAKYIGHGASGRSGGQLLPGYSCGQQVLQQQLGNELAHRLWDISVEAVQLATNLISTHQIECGLKFGHLHAAIKPRHHTELLREQAQLHDEYDYKTLHMIEGSKLHSMINSSRYRAGLYDSAAAHLHPLNYTLGLVRVASKAGAMIHERSEVISIDHLHNRMLIKTQNGTVSAKQIVLCANVDNVKLLPQSRIMPVATYMIATEILGERADQALSENLAVSDCNFIVDYFRMMDSRLLFGGGVSYSGHARASSNNYLRQRMLKVFPQLHDVNIEYAWHGMLDISMNRAPDFGRIENNIYYLQGFSGHGLALATMAGKLLAESMAMQSERFDVFSQIKHRSFPGGVLRTPLLMLAMVWYRLRDLQ